MARREAAIDAFYSSVHTVSINLASLGDCFMSDKLERNNQNNPDVPSNLTPSHIHPSVCSRSSELLESGDVPRRRINIFNDPIGFARLMSIAKARAMQVRRDRIAASSTRSHIASPFKIVDN